MKSLFFIAAVALLSQVRPSVGGLFGEGLSKEVGRSASIYVVGFINSNTNFCTKLKRVDICRKKTSGLNILGLVTLFSGGTTIDLSFAVDAYDSNNQLQEYSCTAIVSSKDNAYAVGQYKCPGLGIQFPSGSGK